jgi:GDP-D-mannose dehydratase
MIHTSTSEAYGSAKYVPIDENHPLHAQSPCSASKIGGRHGHQLSMFIRIAGGNRPAL